MFLCENCGYSTKIKCNFIKHQNRKTKCGEKNGSNVCKNGSNVCKNGSNVCKNGSNVCQPGSNVVSNIKDNFVKVDTNRWECKQCSKKISSRSKKIHFEQTCRKGLSIFQCEYCHLMCASRDSKWRHKKTCTKNSQLSSTSSDHMTIHNITTNNITTNNNITNNITNNNFNVFGKEELGYILENMETDPRIRECLKSIVYTIELVHFNRDHPENHTVRKLNKKSELVEFRVMDDTNPTNERWVQESCSTCIPKMKRNLEISLNTRFNDVPSPGILRELMYHKSKQSTFASTECILSEHGNDIRESNVQEMNTRLYDIREDYLKNTLPALIGNYSFLLMLTNKWNNVLAEYGQEPVDVKTVTRIVMG